MDGLSEELMDDWLDWSRPSEASISNFFTSRRSCSKMYCYGATVPALRATAPTGCSSTSRTLANNSRQL